MRQPFFLTYTDISMQFIIYQLFIIVFHTDNNHNNIFLDRITLFSKFLVVLNI